MDFVSVFGKDFQVNTPQTFREKQVDIQGSTGNIHANFFFIDPVDGRRVEVAYYDKTTGILKEHISDIVKIVD